MGDEQGKRTAHGGHDDRDQDEHGPLEGTEHGVQDEKDNKNGDWNDYVHALVGALLTLVLTGPLEVIASRQLHILIYLSNGFFNG